MRDDEELRAGGELFEQLAESADVRLIQRGIHFIHDAEGRRADTQQCEDQRH